MLDTQESNSSLENPTQSKLLEQRFSKPFSTGFSDKTCIVLQVQRPDRPLCEEWKVYKVSFLLRLSAILLC